MTASTVYLNIAAASHVGMVRSNNQDSGYAGQHLVIVADGMGGHAGGDVASASTVLYLLPLDKDHGKDSGSVLAAEIQNANVYLNEIVRDHPEMAGMGTTVTAGLISGNTLHLAHIGDSRAYRLKNGQFEQITKDHTFVQRLVDEGKINAAEAENHPQKNVIMRVLGDVEANPELDLTTFTLEPGERWLFCSDGLSGAVKNEVIKQQLSSTHLQEGVNELVELTLQAGAPDNVTIVAFEVMALEEKPEKLTTALVGAASEVERLDLLAHTPLAERSLASKEKITFIDSAKRSWKMPILALLIPLLLFIAISIGMYQWNKHLYYVSSNNGNVAIWQGFSQKLGPWKLSQVYETSDLQLKKLTSYAQTRIEEKIPASDLNNAQQIVKDLRSIDLQNPCAAKDKAFSCPSPSLTPLAPTPGQGRK